MTQSQQIQERSSDTEACKQNYSDQFEKHTPVKR